MFFHGKKIVNRQIDFSLYVILQIVNFNYQKWAFLNLHFSAKYGFLSCSFGSFHRENK